MPIYRYIAVDRAKSCPNCMRGFEVLQKTTDQSVGTCPKCGRPVHRCISTFAVGISKSGVDNKAKQKGFHKLKRLGRGEFEKVY